MTTLPLPFNLGATYTLLANEHDGLNRFAATARDLELFFRTSSHSGN